MSKITRYNGNVVPFANNAQTGERYVFGSTTEQSDNLTSLVNANYLRGWAIVGPSQFPPLEWFNAQAFTSGQFISYLHQMGVPEWNALQEYPTAGAQVVHNGSAWTRGAGWVMGDEPGVANSTRWTKGISADDLGTAAARDVGEASGNVMEVGAFGLGSAPSVFSGDLQSLNKTQIVYQNAGSGTTNMMGYSGGVVVHFHGAGGFQLYGRDDNFLFRGYTASTYSPTRTVHHTGNILQTTGTSTEFPMSQKAVTDQLLGVGQTWQDVTASRVFGTTYTNNTGRSIMVSIWQTSDTSPSLIVDGVIVASVDGSPGSVGVQATAIVPPNSTYIVTAAVNGWAELR